LAVFIGKSVVFGVFIYFASFLAFARCFRAWAEKKTQRERGERMQSNAQMVTAIGVGSKFRKIHLRRPHRKYEILL
jgi:2-methylisocitrate lyase-like PEP mutase family enzyme